MHVCTLRFQKEECNSNSKKGIGQHKLVYLAIHKDRDSSEEVESIVGLCKDFQKL